MLIPLAEIEKTGLVTARSLVFYRTYIRFTDGTDPEALVEKYKEQFKAARVSWQTPEKRRQDIGKQLDRLYRFLSLVSLASVVLGGIGIASAIHQHVSRRLRSIAILRCLGTPAADAFGIYLIQAVALGLIGCLGGAVLGVAIQASMPALLANVTPLDISFRVSPSAIAVASGLSLLICVSFALFPLLKIRHVPPLAAIRAALLNTGIKQRDRWSWGIGAGLVLVILGFSIWQQGWQWRSVAMSGGLMVVFAFLFLVARLTVYLSRKFVRPWWPFTLRQGLSNLHRPNNQTLAVMVALGLGTFLIVTLVLVQNLLLDQIRQERLAENGNLVLIDVQPEQAAEVRALLESQQTRIIQTAPMDSPRRELRFRNARTGFLGGRHGERSKSRYWRYVCHGRPRPIAHHEGDQSARGGLGEPRLELLHGLSRRYLRRIARLLCLHCLCRGFDQVRAIANGADQVFPKPFSGRPDTHRESAARDLGQGRLGDPVHGRVHRAHGDSHSHGDPDLRAWGAASPNGPIANLGCFQCPCLANS